MRRNICVIAKMLENNMVMPITIIWSKTEKFKIDKVLDIRKDIKTKSNTGAIRYTCLIKGKKKYLWLDDYTWFVELE